MTRANQTGQQEGCVGAPPAEGWQPIGSADRSELEPIILWNGRAVVAGFAWESGWADCWYDWMDPQPTHWMPLPPPPETGA